MRASKHFQFSAGREGAAGFEAKQCRHEATTGELTWTGKRERERDAKLEICVVANDLIGRATQLLAHIYKYRTDPSIHDTESNPETSFLIKQP